ncbi:uncharacterized protein LOC130711872 [Lotus japonicus]|uniref:uncharacterized protein LOC130711872 n=1 Tax=Lotus japonicus TaxID=34305 RepID=UPI00258C6248|nr:uncharacterized protein LOC130711872 [Lotus japonicus]
MGNCSSFDPSTVETAKVVVHDGSLQEFSYPVRVSYLLQMFPACFICDADDLGFDDVVTAVHEDEVLCPGQLYFALPMSRLDRPLPAVELAALAVKACSALSKSGGGGDKCGPRRKQVVMFSGEGNVKAARRAAPGYGGSVDNSVGALRRGRSGRSGGGGGRGKFAAALSTIPE